MGRRDTGQILVLFLLPALLLSCRAMPATSQPELVRSLALDAGFAPLERPPFVRPALTELGRALAFDKILSGDRDISCSTCHHPRHATGDGRRLPLGGGGEGLGPERHVARGEMIPRNSPPLFNLFALDSFFWDGRVAGDASGAIRTPAGDALTESHIAAFEFGPLSAVAMFPVMVRSEMRGYSGNDLAELPDLDFPGVWSALMVRLGEFPEYRRMFEAAYPGSVFEDLTFAHASNAIAGFLISDLSFADTPWDHFLAGDDAALSEMELAGARHFLEAACSECHAGGALSDNDFHNVALAQYGPGVSAEGDDLGRSHVSRATGDRYAFRTSPLRNIELTGPYGHAGQFRTLRDFISHYGDSESKLRGYDYDQGHLPLALRASLRRDWQAILQTRDPLLEGVQFDEQTVDELTAFMGALTDERARDLVDLTPTRVASGLPVDR